MSGMKTPVSLMLGVIMLAAIIAAVAGAPLLTSHDPLQQTATERLKGLSAEHPFGTDRFGRDVFSRTLYGGRITLASSFAALLTSLIIGVWAGLTCGMFTGTVIDAVLMRITDIILSFPFMVLAMIIAALFGTSLYHLLAAGIFVWWVPFARMTRSIVLKAKSDTSVEAATILGAPRRTIMTREFMPRAIGLVFVQATFELGTMILSLSALSFLGLGAQPPLPEWGSMLSDGRVHFLQAPHILLGPALFIVLTVLALNLIGEGLRDRMDPYEIIRF